MRQNQTIGIVLFIAAGFTLFFNPIPIVPTAVQCPVPPNPCPPPVVGTNYNPWVAIGLGILGAIFYFKEGARMGATKMSRRMIAIIILATAGLLFLLSQNLLIIGLVGVGGYLYYKSGDE